MGLPKSLNLGIKQARGNFIIRVTLMIMLIGFSFNRKFANLNPDTDAFACDYYLVDDNEKIIKRVNCLKNQ